MANQTIGTVTSYLGEEHRYLNGYQVKVIAVFKHAATPDRDPDAGYDVATTDDELARLGGLEANDRVEVVPWIAREGRWSFVSSDPRAQDLAAFKGLR